MIFPSLLQQISSRGALKSFQDTVERMKAVPAEYDSRKGFIKSKLESMLRLLRDAGNAPTGGLGSSHNADDGLESKSPDLLDVEEGGQIDSISPAQSPSRGGTKVSVS